jgi:hypothetical protein
MQCHGDLDLVLGDVETESPTVERILDVVQEFSIVDRQIDRGRGFDKAE